MVQTSIGALRARDQDELSSDPWNVKITTSKTEQENTFLVSEHLHTGIICPQKSKVSKIIIVLRTKMINGKKSVMFE